METQSLDDLSSRFARISYCRPFRRYQSLALEAFERARAQGQRCSYLVLPPGAGKTVLGLEIARRLGNRALVLCPNTAVQSQWLRQWLDFQPALVSFGHEVSLDSPLTAVTYQAVCNLDGGEAGLDERALALWRETLEADESLSTDEAEARLQALAATGSERYRDDLAYFRNKARTLIARGGDRAQLLSLLHANGRSMIERMKASGPWTLILDECHHLLEMWGYLVRALIEELADDVFVVGLTATPPGDMEAREEALYRELFGQANFEVPTPTVVKEGDLAPYQELAYLTFPLDHESAYIEEQNARFQRLLDRLMDDDFGSLYFLQWLRRRVGERRTRDGAEVSWARFERDHPRLAEAALRFFYHSKMDLPPEARLGERHRQPPTADDWVVLIEDYCMGHLRASTDPRDQAAWEEIRQSLPSLGYVLTRQGIRSYVSPVDRVLSLSASKSAAALEILATERESLGDRLRALVLCDYERAGRDVLAKLRGVLDPQAGSAALLMHVLLSDPAVAALNPMLLTGRTVACSRGAAACLCSWIEEQVPELRGIITIGSLFSSADGETSGSWDDLVVVSPGHPWWQPRHYVPLLTRYFEAGHSRCLVGTRGLLGEGWDATCVNVLIDLTAASTSTSVHQMRGRSLRLDPSLPSKVANNWDVVCVAPDHPKGTADYARFVRKHRQYYAPTAEGEIESGVSHVHPELSPYGPPTAAAFSTINGSLLDRARDREGAYDRWEIGKPYENKETHTVRVRAGRSIGLTGHRLIGHSEKQEKGISLRGRVIGVTVAAGGVLLLGAVDGVALAGLIGGIGVAGVGYSWVARSLARSLGTVGPSAALEDIAMALAEGLKATGGIGAALGADSVRVSLQHDGYYRCYLAGASLDESRLFAESLDELLSPISSPRYIIPRYIADPPKSSLGAAWLYLRRNATSGAGSKVVYHGVPAYLGANKERVEAFCAAWNRFVSPGKPLYYQDPIAQGIIEVQRGANPFDVTTQMRTLWH